MIGAIRETLEIDSFPDKSPLLLLALTSVETFNIFASTLDSSLNIRVMNMTTLEGSRLIKLQEDMQHAKYILIDEMSLIGRKLLS